MRIEPDIKLDFDSVLICPKRSQLTTRDPNKGGPTLYRDFTFKHSGYQYHGVPIMASNMDYVGTFSMAQELKKFDMFTVLRKHYTFEQWENAIGKLSLNHIAVCTGTSVMHNPNAEDYTTMKRVVDAYGPKYLCIDVANGYQENFADFVKMMRSEFPTITIIAGNVATYEMTEQLILSGADIVKIGIGPGCLTANARILMANGTYKNIIDIQVGDNIITATGESATVKQRFCTGTRNVRKIRNAHFHAPLILTSDHKCFVGDYSSVSHTTLSKRGYKKVLQTPTRDGQSKLGWKEAQQLAQCTGLMPNTIQWDLPESFSYNISDFFKRKEHIVNYNQVISSTYELGYMLGFFLGNGTTLKPLGTNNKGFSSYSGRVDWFINSNDKMHIDKLCTVIHLVTGKLATCEKDKNRNLVTVTLYNKQWSEFFQPFGKKTNKVLPVKYRCMDKNYLQGLHDGLIDSGGYITEDDQMNFYNTSTHLIELFGWVTAMLTGSFPTVINNGKQSSYLVEAQHDTYRSFLTKSHATRQLNNYQIIKLLKVTDECDEFPVYDLEIDHPTHSFIANNMIVHNSVCTTRIMTGVGYPQLSAIIECADAAHGLNGHIIADGGCKHPDDVAKAFGAGADFVMLGGMLAAHNEGKYKKDDFNRFKLPFYGMSSDEAMSRHSTKKDGYRGSEGKKVYLDPRGPVKNTVENILGGVRSACTYVGAQRLKDLSKRTTFIRVNQTHNRVFE